MVGLVYWEKVNILWHQIVSPPNDLTTASSIGIYFYLTNEIEANLEYQYKELIKQYILKWINYGLKSKNSYGTNIILKLLNEINLSYLRKCPIIAKWPEVSNKMNMHKFPVIEQEFAQEEKSIKLEIKEFIESLDDPKLNLNTVWISTHRIPGSQEYEFFSEQDINNVILGIAPAKPYHLATLSSP